MVKLKIMTSKKNVCRLLALFISFGSSCVAKEKLVQKENIVEFAVKARPKVAGKKNTVLVGCVITAGVVVAVGLFGYKWNQGGPALRSPKNESSTALIQPPPAPERLVDHSLKLSNQLKIQEKENAQLKESLSSQKIAFTETLEGLDALASENKSLKKERRERDVQNIVHCDGEGEMKKERTTLLKELIEEVSKKRKKAPIYADFIQERANEIEKLLYLNRVGSQLPVTPCLIHLAAFRGDVPTLERLVSKLGLNPSVKAHDGTTPLHAAVIGGKDQGVSFLLDLEVEKDSFIEKGEWLGYNPLHIACQKGHAAIVNTLLKARVCKDLFVTEGARAGYSALHLACAEGHADVVRILLNAGLSSAATTRNREGRAQNAFQIARSCSQKEIGEILFKESKANNWEIFQAVLGKKIPNKGSPKKVRFFSTISGANASQKKSWENALNL